MPVSNLRSVISISFRVSILSCVVILFRSDLLNSLSVFYIEHKLLLLSRFLFLFFPSLFHFKLFSMLSSSTYSTYILSCNFLSSNTNFFLSCCRWYYFGSFLNFSSKCSEIFITSINNRFVTFTRMLFPHSWQSSVKSIFRALFKIYEINVIFFPLVVS